MTLASALAAAAGLLSIACLESAYPAPGVIWKLGDAPLLVRSPGGIAFFRGLLPVVPLTVRSTVALVVGSLATRPPSRATIERYFQT